MPQTLPSQVLNNRFVLPDVQASEVDAQDVSKLSGIAASWHGIHLEDFGLLLPSHEVNEIIGDVQVCELPGTAEVLSGMLNLRGNIIPLFDLRILLELTVSLDHPPEILIISEQENAVGVMIPQLPIKVMLAETDKVQTSPPVPKVLQGFVTDIYDRNETLWFGWDIAGFFTAVGKNL